MRLQHPLIIKDQHPRLPMNILDEVYHHALDLAVRQCILLNGEGATEGYSGIAESLYVYEMLSLEVEQEKRSSELFTVWPPLAHWELNSVFNLIEELAGDIQSRMLLILSKESQASAESGTA